MGLSRILAKKVFPTLIQKNVLKTHETYRNVKADKQVNVVLQRDSKRCSYRKATEGLPKGYRRIEVRKDDQKRRQLRGQDHYAL